MDRNETLQTSNDDAASDDENLEEAPGDSESEGGEVEGGDTEMTVIPEVATAARPTRSGRKAPSPFRMRILARNGGMRRNNS